ncbi:DUF2852 domain-containing protein [Methylocystis sp. B8]|uniref:DUF2852 domain-containing protein n=1 Tax=Methylocystis sp. B8 TaxID=544938 RepID=UPI0010FDB033|nr:DUF2852 domain-containing protein [Methylocystis sp. B8]TLG76968.1 DUF2852 domain-containing protein [Methylocystis sp. B8]
MSCHRYSRMSSSGERGSPWGHCGRMPWRPYEIAAVILGFFIFWPLGVAILFWKLWQKSQGYEGDLFAFAQEQGARVKEAVSGVARETSAGWGGPSFMRSTGNVAFDEWREGELARLEEERRKLAEAERDFAEHIEQLRRARDREEFESFMRGRKNGESKGA